MEDVGFSVLLKDTSVTASQAEQHIGAVLPQQSMETNANVKAADRTLIRDQ